jgi:hypothetical protein
MADGFDPATGQYAEQHNGADGITGDDFTKAGEDAHADGEGRGELVQTTVDDALADTGPTGDGDGDLAKLTGELDDPQLQPADDAAEGAAAAADTQDQADTAETTGYKIADESGTRSL